MVYPRVYFQMRRMLKICQAMEHTAKDKAYVAELIAQLKAKCAEIDAEVRADADTTAAKAEATMNQLADAEALAKLSNK